MFRTIQSRLAMGFFAVIILFSISGFVSVNFSKKISSDVEQLTGVYWDTSDFLMETRIKVGEIGKTVFAPPAGLDVDQFTNSTLQFFDDAMSHLGKTALDTDAISAIKGDLASVRETFAEPVRLFSIPQTRMEEADEAVNPLLAKAKRPAILNWRIISGNRL